MFPLHDRSYNRLFSHPRWFQQLLEHFVNEPWVKDLDFEQCEKVTKSFISAHYKSTESDLLYKVQIQGQKAYIYILLEFQSTVTWFMVVRLLHYMSSFWLDYAENQPQQKKLPALFPILLYSGDEKWTAATDLADLLENPQLFASYTPQFRYFKIAENEYSPAQLLQISNLVSTLFLAETHPDLDLLQQELLKLFDREADQEAISLLLNWFKQLVVHGRREVSDYDVLEQVYRDKVEVKQMLETTIAKEREKLLAQGRAEGRAEGKVAGEREGWSKGKVAGEKEGWNKGQAAGQAELFISLLEMRFQPLTRAQKQYLYELSPHKLLKLAEQLWHAQSLPDILKEGD